MPDTATSLAWAVAAVAPESAVVPTEVRLLLDAVLSSAPVVAIPDHSMRFITHAPEEESVNVIAPDSEGAFAV